MSARSARTTRRAAAVAPAAFALQRSGASARQLVLFELERARVAVQAAIQGLGAGPAERPMAPGKWSVREVVLHLVVRDQVRIDELEAIRRGTPPSWAHLDKAAWAGVNEAHIAPLRPLAWDEAVRRLERTREALLAALASVPEEPAEVWSASHPLGATLGDLVRHDRHHAERIKAARIAG